MNKKITIEQLTEGYLIIAESGDTTRRTKTRKKKVKICQASGTRTISETDPDRIYRPFGLSKTQVDRDQEYTKIEGDI